MSNAMEMIAEVFERPIAPPDFTEDQATRLHPSTAITFGLAISLPVCGVVGWALTVLP